MYLDNELMDIERFCWLSHQGQSSNKLTTRETYKHEYCLN